MGKLKPINPTKAQIVANPQAAAHDYDNLIHKPQITGHELVGNKTGDELGLQDYNLTEQDKIDIANIVLSELPTTQGVLYGELPTTQGVLYGNTSN